MGSLLRYRHVERFSEAAQMHDDDFPADAGAAAGIGGAEQRGNKGGDLDCGATAGRGTAGIVGLSPAGGATGRSYGISFAAYPSTPPVPARR